MRNITIAVALFALGALAYFTLSGDDTDPATVAKDEAMSAESSSGADNRSSTLVMPRRMKAPLGATGQSERMEQGQELADRLDARKDRQSIRAEMLSTYDLNGDGELSDEERDALREARSSERLARQLEAFDDNRDGKLDGDELAVQVQARSEMQAERLSRMLGETDSDADGKISRSEAEAGDLRIQRVLRDFDEVDQDGDGQVTSEELQSAMASRRGGPRPAMERDLRAPGDRP